MQITDREFKVLEFNIEGFLKLSKEHLDKQAHSYIFQKNEVQFDTEWQIAIGADLAFLNITATYEPINKLNLSKLATYKAFEKISFTLMSELLNEKDVLKQVYELLYNQLAIAYHKNLIGTKINVIFPTGDESQLNQLVERLSVSLHKAIEKVRKFLQ